MIDYSFLRLKDDFSKAKNLDDSPVTEVFYNDIIQLSPKEAYCQITNVEGGISFQGDFNADLVNCSDISVKDITQNVFIEEITDSNGNTQLCIELININKDFYRETLFIRLTHTLSNTSYWSVPINITDYQINQTSFFQYKSYDDFLGIPYTNSQKWQSIRLRCYFDIPIDESETQDYYQISRQRTISSRTLIKTFNKYQLDYINVFCFERLNALLKSDLVYINKHRITNKPTVSSDDREGLSNFFTTNFIAAIDKNDFLEYDYQVFEGLNVVTYSPLGNYTNTNLPDDGFIQFNYPIEIGSGNIYMFDESDALLETFNVLSSNVFIDNTRLNITDITNQITDNQRYYYKYDSGIVNFLGIENEALENSDDWFVNIANADFNGSDFNNSDFYTD